MVMRVVSVKMPEELLELLEEFARKRGLTKSEVIRRAIMEYLSERPDVKVYRSRRLKIYA